MAIQYSGLTIINTTFSTTTRLDVVTGIAAALSSAGWTNISGSGTGNQVWKSMTTPQGYAIRVQLLDPGSGNCAQVFLQNAIGSITQPSNPGFLLPGSTYRIIANGYQFFVFVPTNVTARGFVAVVCPYVPSFLTGTNTAFGCLHGIAQNDTDASVTNLCWRISLNGAGGNQCCLTNTTIWANFSNATYGSPMLIPTSYENIGGGGVSPYRYLDTSLMICDAIIAWSVTSYNTEAFIMGQLWDACLIVDSFVADATATFDSHNWFNLTNNNSGSGSFNTRGSLFLAVP